MEIISLGILLKDREYAEALARAIAASERYFLPMVLDRDQLHNFDEKEKVIIISAKDLVNNSRLKSRACKSKQLALEMDY